MQLTIITLRYLKFIFLLITVLFGYYRIVFVLVLVLYLVLFTGMKYNLWCWAHTRTPFQVKQKN